MLPRKLMIPLLAVALTACAAPIDDSETWIVNGGVTVATTDLSRSITGIELLIDKTVVSSASGSPSAQMVVQFPGQALPRGSSHTLRLKLVSQVGTTIDYRVLANLTMQKSPSEFDLYTYQWPLRTYTLRAGDVVDFTFTVR